jgi:hypothetical protein
MAAKKKASNSEVPKVKQKKILSPKEQATKAGKPWVDINMYVDPENPHSGYHQLDWNDLFIDKLKAEGYSGSTDDEIMAQYLKVLCAVVASENEEFVDALAKPKINRKANDDGTAEYF